MTNRAAVFGRALLSLTFLVSFNVSEAGVRMPAAATFEGTEWKLVEVSGAPVSALAGQKQPHIMFDPEQKRATGFAGCNNFFGGYEIDEASLRFGPVGSTRMACPDLQLSLETEFLKALEKTDGWKIADGVLFLLGGSEVLARFTKEIQQGITGTVWHWEQTQYSDDRTEVPADPGSYFVQFREDGTLNVKADCNQKGGTYSLEEGRLSIEITHSTMAACPDGSLEDAFVRGLSAAAIFFIRDGDLYLDLKYDSGTMRFSKQKEK
jgi:heat shock protein HslJ